MKWSSQDTGWAEGPCGARDGRPGTRAEFLATAGPPGLTDPVSLSLSPSEC
ncbi:hypothetical protein STTU_3727 [Streptomyces sp. Tu6071]|nr:predicted protein [Streptomyces sp. SPB78]EGJ76515.1 hypothetical protein STTU_3727 [Streptomyces sp. Tu6071]